MRIEKKFEPSEKAKPKATALKFYADSNAGAVKAVIANDGGLEMALKELTGVADADLANGIIQVAVNALKPLPADQAFNMICQSLNDVRPKDGIEARLAAQAAVLYSKGMEFLQKLETSQNPAHVQFSLNASTKLFRLHNETIEALNKHRRGGEQKFTVTHAIVAQQAVVNIEGPA